MLIIKNVPNPKNNNKKYATQYSIVGQLKKKGQPWRAYTFDGNFIAKQIDINKKLNSVFKDKISQLEEESQYEVKDMEIKSTSKTRVKKGINPTLIKHKWTGALMLDKAGIDYSFDRKLDTCVYDLLYERYGSKMDRESYYNFLDNIFIDDDNANPRQDGVDIQQIERFCIKKNITFICLDRNDNCLIYKKATSRNHKALICYSTNSHLYPVEDQSVRNSIVKTNNTATKQKVSSSSIATKVKKEKEYEYIHNETEMSPNEWALSVIKECNTLPSKTYVEDGNRITKMIIGDRTYITDSLDTDLCDYYSGKDKYKGQSIYELTYSYLKGLRRSYFNNNVEKILYTYGVKDRSHFGLTEYGASLNLDVNNINAMIDAGELSSIDICKCYTSCLMEIQNWLYYDADDNWEDYDGELKLGLYMVETNDMTLLHQSNIYSNTIIQYALENGIELIITKQLIHTKKSIYEPTIDMLSIINKIKSDCDNYGGLSKTIINMISGYLGKTKNKKYNVNLDQNEDSIWEYIEKNGVEDLILASLKQDNISVHIFGKIIKTELYETNLPMFIQVLDKANIKLHQLSKQMGEVIFRKTDMILAEGNKMPLLSDEIGGYKVEKKEIWKLGMMRTDRNVCFETFKEDWIMNPLNDSDDRELILDSIDQKGGGLICGRAGTGKSYCIKSDRFDNENSFRMAFTNIATLLMTYTNNSITITAKTIHRTLGINKNDEVSSKLIINLGKNKKYCIIDEIGMINRSLWKHILLLKKLNPHLIFILMGDYRQLPPVEEGLIGEYDIFNSPIVKYLCNYNMIELTTRKRYDVELWNFLERGYENDNWSGLTQRKVSTEEIITSKNISRFNNTRREINRICMNKRKQSIEYKKLDMEELEQTTYLYIGLPLMAIKNNAEMGFVNSEQFLVEKYDDENIYLEGGIVIDIKDYWKYFRVNYCSTTHKCQGATYTGKIIIWDWNKMINDKKMTYTACSRATQFNNIIVAN